MARSPAVEKLPFTALPHVASVTLVNELGAVQRKENVVTPPDAALGAVWVISASPPAPEMVCVPSAAPPPVASTPLGPTTFNPARCCTPTSETVTVYSWVESGKTDAGPVSVTVGAVPPPWQLLQPTAGENDSLVMPPEKAATRDALAALRRHARTRVHETSRRGEVLMVILLGGRLE